MQSDAETFLHTFHVAKHQKLGIWHQYGMRGDVHAERAVLPHGHDIDIIFFADIQLTYCLANPCGRDGNLKNSVIAIQLNVVENMI